MSQEQFEIVFDLGSRRAREQFAAAINKADRAGPGYQILVPDDALQSENEILQLFIKFMESGGLGAIEKVADAIACCFEFFTVRELVKIHIKRNDKTIEVKPTDTVEEIKEKLKDGLQ
jgi:hypothetical protein